ncbi:Bug family tripartite tricarboxylate transporter substrate binding protein [Comamonas endophytica]|uniref:Bug family tripartite tricarboxylate transporter substrate binding protein n=1 Tax=Comamonas endophytica TaxID=2949090 RepID=A0ABY6GBR1_9BURK|nr:MULTISPECIES: Bug family tripartite tricarboxylate transporter substrate binding protein [unclassified Acidovorax]MCD2513480.1 Bug family tripartite tricarboxylate transporter substrate binding protein [Acidovorax sp. D4N7]UYG52505.1 Bug family tripartite tricarboxylate transporter substrate binding protein [Acidovorax sp. 5MLIR]
MRLTRRRLLSHAAVLSSVAAWGPIHAADPQPIRILVGFPPGGGSDAIARLLAEKLRDALGLTVLVDNRPGAGGQIAAQLLKSAPADGHTLFLSHDHTISILPQVVRKPGFDPEQDFVPVAGIATFVNALAVSSQTPARNLAEYVQWVRQQGGKSAVGIPAPASTPEFLVKQLSERFELDLVAAPYRGSAPMLADMLGHQIPAGIGSVQDFIENHRAGKIRVIAVLGERRQAAMPEVPTLAEQGVKGYEDLPYYGIYAPRGTPAAFIERFSAAISRVLQLPEVREQLTALGLTVGHMAPAQLAQRERAYTRAWTGIIRRSGFQPQ